MEVEPLIRDSINEADRRLEHLLSAFLIRFFLSTIILFGSINMNQVFYFPSRLLGFSFHFQLPFRKHISTFVVYPNGQVRRETHSAYDKFIPRGVYKCSQEMQSDVGPCPFISGHITKNYQVDQTHSTSQPHFPMCGSDTSG